MSREPCVQTAQAALPQREWSVGCIFDLREGCATEPRKERQLDAVELSVRELLCQEQQRCEHGNGIQRALVRGLGRGFGMGRFFHARRMCSSEHALQWAANGHFFAGRRRAASMTRKVIRGVDQMGTVNNFRRSAENTERASENTGEHPAAATAGRKKTGCKALTSRLPRSKCAGQNTRHEPQSSLMR